MSKPRVRIVCYSDLGVAVKSLELQTHISRPGRPNLRWQTLQVLAQEMAIRCAELGFLPIPLLSKITPNI